MLMDAQRTETRESRQCLERLEVPLAFAIWHSSWSKAVTICEVGMLGTPGFYVHANHSWLLLGMGCGVGDRDRQRETETQRQRTQGLRVVEKGWWFVACSIHGCVFQLSYTDDAALSELLSRGATITREDSRQNPAKHQSVPQTRVLVK